jgi:putative DNA-invertase from lambdoid prophage Rac
MKAAIYVRVSTDKQTTDNQLPALRQVATARGFSDVDVFSEVESGAKRRPVLEQLVADAKRGRYSVILVWALDRLGRGGALEALSLLEDLARARVGVLSYSEPWLDSTADNPLRDVLIAFSATVARMERERLVVRTRAGIARYRAVHGRWGRRPVSPVAVHAAADAVRAGMSQRAAAKKWGIGVSTLRDFLTGRRRPTEPGGAQG